jgi:hypothetical protein
MPGKPFAWITDADGARQLFPEELAKALGLPKSWDVPTKALTSKLLANTSSVFHWEYISQCLVPPPFCLTSKGRRSSSWPFNGQGLWQREH